jgi:hypothetical protein
MVWLDGLNTDHFTGLLRGDPWLFPKEEPMPTTPTITADVTITIKLDRGQTGETYTWSKEEAEAIRQQLEKVLGPAYRPPVSRGGTFER